MFGRTEDGIEEKLSENFTLCRVTEESSIRPRIPFGRTEDATKGHKTCILMIKIFLHVMYPSFIAW